MNNENIKQQINLLIIEYKNKLNHQINQRIKEMKNDDTSHELIYRVLGISKEEGQNIDLYQNKGRFLYKYAGSFLEEVTQLCFKTKYQEKLILNQKISNTLGSRPKNFEIDMLIDNLAYEIKWRDATTDGDHVLKEHTRIQVIQQSGYIPVRLMFFIPNREQAQKIQNTIKTLYLGINGQYYSGEDAWNYVYQKTSINLKQILIELSEAQ